MHPTVTRLNHGMPVAVDSEIAPLVQALWDSGIDTLSSCQGFSDGIAHVDIESGSAEQLARLIRHIGEPWAATVSLSFPQSEVYNRKTGQHVIATFRSFMTLTFPRKDAAQLSRVIGRGQ
jgi:hypothetical protein